MTINRKVQARVKRSKGSVFLRSDFKDIADYDQVGRALRELVREDLLIKIGYGLYARARKYLPTFRLFLKAHVETAERQCAYFYEHYSSKIFSPTTILRSLNYLS